MTPIRVLVIDDSATVRRRLIDAIDGDPALRVIAEAGDGEAGIVLCERLRPNVVTLDMALGRMSGLEVTERIMAYCPTPILIVSASANRGTAYNTYDAVAAGAVDVLEKPQRSSDDAWDERLRAYLKTLSRLKVITHLRGRFATSAVVVAPPALSRAVRSPGERPRAVVIGASTGGAAALVEILRGLPRDFPVPILLLMHLPEGFGPSFVGWLAQHSPLPVREVADGESLPADGAGVVLVAMPGRHMVIADGRLRLMEGAERHGFRPSIDIFFESVARDLGACAVGCLLTGMGRDGAAGLLAIREAGGLTLAQDEATSVIFGMPRAAIEAGAVDIELPLSAIAPTLIESVALRSR